jgi:hypothetical protein
MTGWEKLQEHGLAAYDDAAIAAVDLYVELSRALPAHGAIAESTHRDYLLLSACEIVAAMPLAAPPSAAPTKLKLPMHVTEQAAWLGIAKNNTSWWMCGVPDSLHEASMWDVVSFGGDMSKLAAMGVNRPEELYVDAETIVPGLQAGFERARGMLGVSPIDTSTIALLGAIWLGKLACIAGDEPGERISRFLGEVVV